MTSKETNTFNAIVVGSGMSDGWAAKELTERGRNIKHVTDYTRAMTKKTS
jgi:choline dehydrogenase-like flavoprotein